jgi:glycosyltransferase involved in cell wall biosynthesis
VSEPNGISRPPPASRTQVAEPPRVSVIIPVLNDFARLTTCLTALSRQTWPRERLEVLVVDNGSTGDIGAVVAPFDFVRLLHEVKPGSYCARNRALREARGAILAFTDSDCIPDPGWLEQGVLALQAAGGLSVVGGKVELFAQDPEQPTLAEDFELALGFSQQSYIEEKHYCVTANLFTTPAVFEKVGGFNEALKSGGDKEWGGRAHAAGVPLIYAAAARLRHPARRTMQELFKKRARLVGGHLGIARSKHPEWLAFSKVLAKACLPPVERVLKARKKLTVSAAGNGREGTKPRTLRTTLRVVVVGVSLQAYSVAELMRLRFGGKPVR